MNEERLQFWSLYLSRFATGFGTITLVTLIPIYIDTILGVSDFVGGLFITGFTLAQTIAVIPLALAGDRRDKKRVLLGVLLVSIVAYVAFTNVMAVGDAVAAVAGLLGLNVSPTLADGAGFIGVRALQGAAVTGSGLMTLALVGELADHGQRANSIGKANSVRFLASILGTLFAGGLYQTFGLTPIYTTIVVTFALAVAGVWLYLPADESRSYGNPFAGLALNKRIITLTSFRAQYAVAVTLVRSWASIYAGVSAARGGLGYKDVALAISLVIVAEKLTNMLCQPFTGRLSDDYGRSLFVFAGGGAYGLIAVAIPFSPAIGEALSLPATFPLLGSLSSAFIPLLVINGLLGVADAFREPASMALFADEGADEGGIAASFGIRELVWRPGSVLGPVLAGWLWSQYGIETVFYVGGAFAVTGALTFAVVLTRFHGRDALTEW